MTTPAYILRSNTVAARRVGDELMVMCGRTSELFSLNPTAAILWDAADGTTPLVEIVDRDICAVFEVDAATALMDARELALALSERGILKVADAPFASGPGSPP